MISDRKNDVGGTSLSLRHCFVSRRSRVWISALRHIYWHFTRFPQAPHV